MTTQGESHCVRAMAHKGSQRLGISGPPAGNRLGGQRPGVQSDLAAGLTALSAALVDVPPHRRDSTDEPAGLRSRLVRPTILSAGGAYRSLVTNIATLQPLVSGQLAVSALPALPCFESSGLARRERGSEPVGNRAYQVATKYPCRLDQGGWLDRDRRLRSDGRTARNTQLTCQYVFPLSKSIVRFRRS